MEGAAEAAAGEVAVAAADVAADVALSVEVWGLFSLVGQSREIWPA